MSDVFDGVFLYLLGFISLFAGSASSLPIEVGAARDLKKDVDLNLPCSKQLCFTSCGMIIIYYSARKFWALVLGIDRCCRNLVEKLTSVF